WVGAGGGEVGGDRWGARGRGAAGATPRLLPQLPAGSVAGARPRLVQGEILSDDDGRYYEKIGRHIRPLQRLFSGPRGEVLELPSESQVYEQRGPSPHAPDAETSKTEAHPKTQIETHPERP